MTNTPSKFERALAEYEANHKNGWNIATHTIGIPLILFSLLALVTGHFTVFLFTFFIGWFFQFLGHFIEGNKPKFFEHPLFFVIGPLYFFIKLFKR